MRSESIEIKKLLIGSLLYFSIIAAILVHNIVITISRVDVTDLNLVGKTVNESVSILKSEGYENDDYILMTDDGSTPGTSWKVSKIEAGRQVRIFVKSEELPNLSDLNIVGLNWSSAKEILSRYGYFDGENIKIKTDDTIWLMNSYVVSSVSDSKGSAPVINLSSSDG